MNEVKIRTKKIRIKLVGTTPIMFDRYSGNNQEQLEVMDKVYLDQSKKFLVIPSTNILSFLSATNTESAPQRVIGRGYKKVCKAAQSFVQLTGEDIFILRDGKKIEKQKAVDDGVVVVHSAIARIMKGSLAVPNPKSRPLLSLPWEVNLVLTLYETPDLNEVLLRKLFDIGGLAIGLGTYRGVFGKFYVSEWVIE